MYFVVATVQHCGFCAAPAVSQKHVKSEECHRVVLKAERVLMKGGKNRDKSISAGGVKEKV